MANVASEGHIHPLRDSFLYDSGANEHICNDISRFNQSELRWLDTPTSVLTGAGPISILAYGTATIYPQLSTGDQKSQFELYNCAYAPLFTVNLVSARKLRVAGISWSTGSNDVEYRGRKLFKLTEAYGQYLLEYRHLQPGGFAASVAQPADARVWHLRLGHLGPEEPWNDWSRPQLTPESGPHTL